MKQRAHAVVLSPVIRSNKEQQTNRSAVLCFDYT